MKRLVRRIGHDPAILERGDLIPVLRLGINATRGSKEAAVEPLTTQPLFRDRPYQLPLVIPPQWVRKQAGIAAKHLYHDEISPTDLRMIQRAYSRSAVFRRGFTEAIQTIEDNYRQAASVSFCYSDSSIMQMAPQYVRANLITTLVRTICSIDRRPSAHRVDSELLSYQTLPRLTRLIIGSMVPILPHAYYVAREETDPTILQTARLAELLSPNLYPNSSRAPEIMLRTMLSECLTDLKVSRIRRILADSEYINRRFWTLVGEQEAQADHLLDTIEPEIKPFNTHVVEQGIIRTVYLKNVRLSLVNYELGDLRTH